MTLPRKIVLVALHIGFLAPAILAQNATPSAQLISYSNDSLGFSIDLPCVPILEPPTIPGSKPILACTNSIPMVMINSEKTTIQSDKELDAYLKKQIQVEGAPVEIKRMRIDGHRARRVSLSANGQKMELMLVVHGDRVDMFALIQPADQSDPIDPKIFRSIKLK
ncbi:MAG: hypothetical protein LKM36_15885 [Flavobacteriales bacterium]|jgi:hypothetical protein|nr:hypothetical protein [Flavobacteriales bacterium]